MNLTRLAALSFRGSHVWAVHGVIGVMTLGMLWGGGALGRAESRARELRLLVRSAFEDFPLTLGGSEEWMFVDEVEIPTTQVAMLGLNTYVSRVYRRLGSYPPVLATVFLANAVDARSMAGHHPPNCYPANGWIMLPPTLGERRSFASAIGLKLPVRIYRFERGSGIRSNRWVVSGFLMPGRGGVSTLGETHVSSSRLESSRLGLTQFQIVMDGEISMAEVEQYAEEIVGSLPPRILGAVLASPADDEATLIGGDQ